MKSTNEGEDDDEEEEEEVIVFANFEEGSVDRELLQQPDLKFKIIGLDSSTPIVQLGDTTFKGVWNDTIGTKVLFEEDPSPEQADPVFTVLPPKMLKYKCMTTKMLDLSRIFLKPKNLENDPKNSQESVKLQRDNAANGEQEQVLELAQSTVNPDSNTDVVMKDITEESIMDETG